MKAFLDGSAEALVAERHRRREAALALGGALGRHVGGESAPTEWVEWLWTLLPQYVTHPFADRHSEFWGWVWPIERSSSPDPFVAVWPRGGGKTTSAELACVALGVRGRRRYAWYVNETQDKADKNVENIGAILESQAVERHYPHHSARAVGKYGQSKGWRRNRLRTAGGFTVDALGLDTAQRGLKVEEQRPDLIILDDLDGKLDSPATTAKKIETLTTSILPAGSSDVAVLAIQNLIIPDGIFTRMADGRADWLVDRIVSGPHPAVVGLKTEWTETSEGVKRALIVEGEPSWEGQSLDACQGMIDLIGLNAFLKECQHQVKELAEGIALEYDPNRHHQAWSHAEIMAQIANGNLVPFGGIDFGHWRFAFVLCASDRAGRVHVLDEHFSQRDDLSARARDIHDLVTRYGIDPTKFRVWGDSANQTDIVEINRAWHRGWKDGSEKVTSRLRVLPVRAEHKARTASVERLNDLLGRIALLFRRTLGEGHHWKLGHNASREGEPMVGSRLLWEVTHWSYPDPREGKAQKQDPDDNTADGADAIAALRYAVMSWWKPAKVKKSKKEKDRNRDDGLERLLARINREQRRGNRDRFLTLGAR